ncbi:hypothetical protein PIB30_022529 [Stylosanthes scabra]|uniref:Uncharacterized protein n=1 Tax=Stylosanthes scabra TaxID=79078 RepID=A0ABU6W7L9_9FABA|nr:hypothetical protein [Stylosanthes scabra]
MGVGFWVVLAVFRPLLAYVVDYLPFGKVLLLLGMQHSANLVADYMARCASSSQHDYEEWISPLDGILAFVQQESQDLAKSNIPLKGKKTVLAHANDK